MDEGRASPAEPELVRLRLHGQVRPVYVLRWPDHRVPDQRTYPGADTVFCHDGRLVGAHSPTRLLQTVQDIHGPVQPARTLVLDLVRCRRALERVPGRWSRRQRGDLREADDLLWDAAASLGDRQAAEAVRDEDLHRIYQLLWGETDALPPTDRLLVAWDNATAWLRQKVDVIDRDDRRRLYRR